MTDPHRAPRRLMPATPTPSRVKAPVSSLCASHFSIVSRSVPFTLLSSVSYLIPTIICALRSFMNLVKTIAGRSTQTFIFSEISLLTVRSLIVLSTCSRSQPTQPLIMC